MWVYVLLRVLQCKKGDTVEPVTSRKEAPNVPKVRGVMDKVLFDNSWSMEGDQTPITIIR